MGPGTWRDLFRIRCRFIARVDRTSGRTEVKLCNRFRFHSGPCR